LLTGWFIGDNLKRAADQLPPFGQRPQVAQGNRLHNQVANRRRLDRPGDDLMTGGICCQLAEQPVLRAAADNMHWR
jgi:hypothetical protein